MNSLFPTRRVAREPSLKTKEIRGDLATYFVSGGGGVEWQNDCA